MPIEVFSSRSYAKQYSMKIGIWWKFLLHNVDTLTTKNGALGAPKGLCANRTKPRAIFRELWAIYCVWELLARGRRMRVAFLDIFTVEGGSSEGKHGGNFLVLTEQNGRAKRRKFS